MAQTKKARILMNGEWVDGDQDFDEVALQEKLKQAPLDDLSGDDGVPQRDEGHTDPSGIYKDPLILLPPPVPLIDNEGRLVSRLLPTAPSSPILPSEPHGSNVPILKNWNDDPKGAGLAFDTDAAADWLINNHQSCGDHYGRCQAAVWSALQRAGMKFPPVPAAKDMIPLLSHDSKFSAVASGLGNNFYDSTSRDYKPQRGDICVWQGGPTGQYGHIQMCVGFRSDGSAVWMSDFEAREGNFSGMRDPVNHGGEFTVFRQHTVTASLDHKNENGPSEVKPPASPADKAAPPATPAATEKSKEPPKKMLAPGAAA